jgi:hypothetical protein
MRTEAQAGAAIDRARATVHGRLQARRAEIERTVFTRVYALADPGEATDPEYAEGLRAAVPAALAYGLAAIERGAECAPPVPVALLAQARVAARSGVSLDTVLRRYFAGYTLLGDFLIGAAEKALSGAALQGLLRTQASLFDRVIAAVTEEYGREAASRVGNSEQRRAERVEKLLAGELLDATGLAYELDAHHLGAIASGPGAVEGILELARPLDRRLLLVPRGEEAVWAWLGGRRPLDSAEIKRLASAEWLGGVSMAIGEPAQGLDGWRLTHQQAGAALPIALRGPESIVRYRDVALLASMLQDDLLASSLRKLYLAPFSGERDGGAVLRETLRAYLAAERNVSSAAAALKVKRHTVTNRLRTIEDRLECSLSGHTAEIDAALRLEDLGHPIMLYAASTNA